MTKDRDLIDDEPKVTAAAPVTILGAPRRGLAARIPNRHLRALLLTTAAFALVALPVAWCFYMASVSWTGCFLTCDEARDVPGTVSGILMGALLLCLPLWTLLHTYSVRSRLWLTPVLATSAMTIAVVMSVVLPY